VYYTPIWSALMSHCSDILYFYVFNGVIHAILSILRSMMWVGVCTAAAMLPFLWYFGC
jgi:hypothetical protein